MLTTFKKIYSLFDKGDKKIIQLLTVATVMVAFFQVAGIGSIMPFLTVVANPESVEKNRLLNTIYTYLGFNSINAFLIFLGLFSLLILTLGTALMVGTLWVQLRFVHMRSHKLSLRLLENYLEKPYIFFLNQNSSNLGKDVLAEVNIMTLGLLKPAIEILSKGTITLFILIFLIFLNPMLSLSIVTILGGAYIIVYLTIKNKISKLGMERRAANEDRFKTTTEAFGAIKDIKLRNNQKIFLSMYERPSFIFEKTQASYQIYSMVPNYALETIAFTSIIIIVLYLLITGGNINQALPIIGVYLYSMMRLKPMMKTLYSSFSTFRFYNTVLDEMYDDLKLIKRDIVETESVEYPVNLLPFRERLYIENIHFSYPGAKEKLFKGIDLTIHVHTSVALVGPTGSGKTTLVDIILGLLPPERGRVIVDGVPITPDNLQQWQRNLGYVPQHIYLADDTVTRNIAFGIPHAKIDYERVKKAAHMANLHDFIVNEMTEGYDTIIGERGIRLSGGQRQRLGIARALYYNPEILVLDEATSALDGETEDHVFQAITNISKTKTLIMIAHRLTTIKDCDWVYFLDQGEIIAEGTYDQLINTNQRFREFATIKGHDIKYEGTVNSR